jgi:hypothetical protein
LEDKPSNRDAMSSQKVGICCSGRVGMEGTPKMKKDSIGRRKKEKGIIEEGGI